METRAQRDHWAHIFSCWLTRTHIPSDFFFAGIWVRYDAIWEFGFLEELVGRDKVILQADFNEMFNGDSGVGGHEE